MQAQGHTHQRPNEVIDAIRDGAHTHKSLFLGRLRLHSHLGICEVRANAGARCALEKGEYSFFLCLRQVTFTLVFIALASVSAFASQL